MIGNWKTKKLKQRPGEFTFIQSVYFDTYTVETHTHTNIHTCVCFHCICMYAEKLAYYNYNTCVSKHNAKGRTYSHRTQKLMIRSSKFTLLNADKPCRPLSLQRSRSTTTFYNESHYGKVRDRKRETEHELPLDSTGCLSTKQIIIKLFLYLTLGFWNNEGVVKTEMDEYPPCCSWAHVITCHAPLLFCGSKHKKNHRF